MTQKKLIILTAEDMLKLIKEKVVQREEFVISSSSSFLSIIALLNEEMVQRLPHVKSTPA